jgi:hypothetical protein
MENKKYLRAISFSPKENPRGDPDRSGSGRSGKFRQFPAILAEGFMSVAASAKETAAARAFDHLRLGIFGLFRPLAFKKSGER